MRSKRSSDTAAPRRWFAAVCLTTILLFSIQAKSQIAGTGNVQGTVQDSSGAVVPRASVTITDVATQVSHTTRTDNAGVYVFPGLITGTYSLTVVAQGFETYEQTNIVLEIGSSIAINPVLKVGKTETKIEVRAEGLALQTEDASYKQTIDSKDITELPLNSAKSPACSPFPAGRVQLRAMTLPAANTPTKRFPSPLPAATATRRCGGSTAATIRTTWATATCRSRSPTQSASSAWNRRRWGRRKANTPAVTST
jgi:hypothetical protein